LHIDRGRKGEFTCFTCLHAHFSTDVFQTLLLCSTAQSLLHALPSWECHLMKVSNNKYIVFITRPDTNYFFVDGVMYRCKRKRFCVSSLKSLLSSSVHALWA
jgi:hypothetical protein